ncbi:tRNA 2-selenouridine(34) synthase MnmH [Terrimonas pollutisoli]|uniref:tRNA 2-selenouridine(34) synthase MnmH n=1 Tax=Terrimonas pollutisoli TaxID=3034147 RepID=UPI0023ED8D93|nr:tRNA 2-selenouridine(34) synthase MnmH [Terrimonas sp. H1YJ31]
MELAKTFPVLDVRSPGEYNHAHIPGAYNLPLFSDEERKIVGTAYKQQSREVAIKLGLDFFGPKMRPIVEYVESLTASLSAAPGAKPVLVHCWRGGMRSAGVAWLLDLYGFKVYTLAGGYKSYRHWIIETFSFPFSFRILGGYTGSGKTHVLEELKKKGEAVINLEKLACHKGSAFGNIGMPKQPTQEMFENLLGHELRACIERDVVSDGNGRFHTASLSLNQQDHIWLEDESQRIGDLNIPHTLWNSMWQSPLLFITIPFEERLKHIVEEYGQLDQEKMINAITRIKKRLGGLETKTALQSLAAGDIESCFRILLKYYDKLYNKALDKRNQSKAPLTNLDCRNVNAPLIADKITTHELLVK